jgi:adenine-specific DNA-methyltransferase
MAKKKTTTKSAKSYQHKDKDVAMRPDVGTQARFTKKLPSKTYRYDSSLSPALDYDGQNPARELGEWLLRQFRRTARWRLVAIIVSLSSGRIGRPIWSS